MESKKEKWAKLVFSSLREVVERYLNGEITVQQFSLWMKENFAKVVKALVYLVKPEYREEVLEVIDSVTRAGEKIVSTIE